MPESGCVHELCCRESGQDRTNVKRTDYHKLGTSYPNHSPRSTFVMCWYMLFHGIHGSLCLAHRGSKTWDDLRRIRRGEHAGKAEVGLEINALCFVLVYSGSAIGGTGIAAGAVDTVPYSLETVASKLLNSLAGHWEPPHIPALLALHLGKFMELDTHRPAHHNLFEQEPSQTILKDCGSRDVETVAGRGLKTQKIVLCVSKLIESAVVHWSVLASLLKCIGNAVLASVSTQGAWRVVKTGILCKILFPAQLRILSDMLVHLKCAHEETKIVHSREHTQALLRSTLQLSFVVKQVAMIELCKLQGQSKHTGTGSILNTQMMINLNINLWQSS